MSPDNESGIENRISIPINSIKRLPLYYNYIKGLKAEGVTNVSAPAIASYMGLNEVLVRKDLAAVSNLGGRPKTGFNTAELLECIGRFLGYDNINEAILVGAGNLGMALFSYNGFEEYGLRIIAAFDTDETKWGDKPSGKSVFPLIKLKSLCERLKVQIGIICVPAGHAQKVCDLLIDSGIRAIWNFAPAHLTVPAGILVQTENMAASLSLISNHLSNSIKKDWEENK